MAITDLNISVFQFIFGLSHRNFFFDELGIFLAQYLPYLLVIGAIAFVFLFEDWKHRILLGIEGLLAAILARGIVTELIRYFYHSPRPFVALNLSPLVSESSWSFPSGHAMLFFALAMTIFYASRRLGAWYFAFAAINGLARIFVGVHWPLDIIGGALLGIVSAMVVHALFEPLTRELQLQMKRNESK